MSESSLIDAIIQGLRAEIKIFVLQSGADSIDQILRSAKTAEAAYSANTNSTDQVDKLTAKVQILLGKLMNNNNSSDTEQQSTTNRVTFVQPITSEEDRRSSASRSVSPINDSRSGHGLVRSSSRSPTRRQHSTGQWPTTPAGSTNGRMCGYDNDQQPWSSWSQQHRQTTTNPDRRHPSSMPTYNTPQYKQYYSETVQQQVTGN
jgi:hypothetical protein